MLRGSRRRGSSLVVGLGLLLAMGMPAGAASAADDPPFIGWTAALPGLAWQYEPSSAEDCAAGRQSCVSRTVHEMQRRFDPLAAACDHSAVFGLAYLRTTQTYLESSQTPGFYADPAFVNHEDRVFAELYFAANDDWVEGRRERVPPAWRVAFRAAERRQVSGTGDLLLGMNAHVNRDLPFTLAAIGLVAPDGSSRKPDHDKVNAMLNRVIEPLLVELSQRFDPTMEQPDTPYRLGYTGMVQMLQVWRENAWRKAELLVAAPDAAARARVAAAIETDAAATAASITTATSYRPLLSSTTGRDSHCAARQGS